MSHSWVIRTSSILRKYDLPDMMNILAMGLAMGLSMGLSKVEWKKIMNRNIQILATVVGKRSH